MLYNIDINGQAVNVLGNTPKTYSKADKKHLFNDQDDGAKVSAIARKIKELTKNTKDAK